MPKCTCAGFPLSHTSFTRHNAATLDLGFSAAGAALSDTLSSAGAFRWLARFLVFHDVRLGGNRGVHCGGK